MSKVNYVFVGGSGRSGTTLVQKILLSHDSIAGGPEFYFTAPIFSLFEKMSAKSAEDAFHPDIKNSSIRKSFIELYDTFFRPYIDESTLYISEKTPTNIDVVAPLLDLYPESKFINVYRDGRGVLNSHLKVKKRARQKGKNLTEISTIRTSIYWINCIRKGLNAAEENKERVLSISYEKLVTEPETQIKLIFEFLSLPFNESEQDVKQLKVKEGNRDAHVNGVWYTEGMYNRNIDAKSKDSWEKELNSLQLFMANVIMSKELKELGYQIPGYYTSLNKLFFALYYWRDNMRDWKILAPFLKIKRSLQ